MSIWSISNELWLNTSWWIKILMDYSLLIDDHKLIHDWHNKFWRNTNCCSRSTNASRRLITNGWVNTMTNGLNTNWWLSSTRCSRSITGKGVPAFVLRPWLITNLMTKHSSIWILIGAGARSRSITGKGVLTFADGERYEGELRDGRMQVRENSSWRPQ